jgi:hypothetical protein
MSDFKLSIWYRASDEDKPQVETLTAGQVEGYVRPEVGFMHDMLMLRGEGVRRLMLEVGEQPKPRFGEVRDWPSMEGEPYSPADRAVLRDPPEQFDDVERAAVRAAAAWLERGAPAAAKWLRHDYLGER